MPSAPIAQDDTPVRDQFTVNETTVGNQEPLRIVDLANGQVLVIWEGNNPVWPGFHTAQILNPDGTEAIGEFRLLPAQDSGGRLGDVTALSSGGFVATWGEFTNRLIDGVAQGRARVFDETGAPVSNTIVLHPPTETSRNTAQVVELSDGRILFAWTEPKGTDPSVTKAHIYTSVGQPTEDVFTIDIKGLNARLSDINITQDDKLFVTWLHETKPEFNFTSRFGHDGQVFDLEGAAAGNRITIREDSAGLDDRVVLLQNGGFVSVYQTNDGAGDGIGAGFFAADGTLLWGGLVNQNTNHFQYAPEVDVLASGQVVIVWGGVFDVDDVDRSAIKARLFNPDGTAAGGEFLVNEVNFGNQWHPHVTALDNGQFIVTWSAVDGFGDGSLAGVTARIFNADGSRAEGPPPDKDFVLTYERIPYLLRPDQMLENDTDAEGDLLSITAVSGVSALGATVTLRPDGSVVYDPNTSQIISDLDTGEIREDSFVYTVSDGALTDSGTVYVSVGGKTDGSTEDRARDDAFSIGADDLDAAGSGRLRLGDKADGTDLLANDERPGASVQAINGGLAAIGQWFDGNGGGQFRVFLSGAVDFRNAGSLVAPGDTTGFSYVALGDAATVSLTITQDRDPIDDNFDLTAETLAAAGRDWFRLGAKNDNTDLLENDAGADEIVFVNGNPIEEGIWFDGDSGGQFRVFKGGVLDFRNQGDAVEPGDVTGFEYGVVADGLQQSFGVSLTIDDFDFV